MNVSAAKNLIDFILFNVGHLLQLRSQTVAVLRRMNMALDDYVSQIIPGDEFGLNYLTLFYLTV